jgi:hypothetical protein
MTGTGTDSRPEYMVTDIERCLHTARSCNAKPRRGIAAVVVARRSSSGCAQALTLARDAPSGVWRLLQDAEALLEGRVG